MIARYSKSYPYLAIAEYYNVPYSLVLKFSDDLIKNPLNDEVLLGWKLAVWMANYEAHNQNFTS